MINFIKATIFCLLVSSLLLRCSSTDEQYQYEELDNFSTESGNVSDQANESNSQGDFESNEPIGEYENQQQQASNTEMNEYENLLTDGNIGAENVNSDVGGENEFAPGTEPVSNISGETFADNSLTNSTIEALNEQPSANEGSENLMPTEEAQSNDVSSDGYSLATESAFVGTEDIYQTYATLWWVGYNYQRKDKKVYVEIVTKGEPQYEVFQERNQASQPELVVRFLSTQLRRKIVRDIDASEFRSPIAYVRMREDNIEGHVDVVLTLRDESKPNIFAKDGNFLLTYDIPEKYLGPVASGVTPKFESAELVGTENVSPQFETGSDLPKSMQVVERPSNAIETNEMQAVEYGDIPSVQNSSLSTNIPAPNDLPNNFQNSAPQVVTTVIPDQEQPPVENVSGTGQSQDPSSNVAGTDSAVELPDVSLPSPAKTKPYPREYQAPYRQPYQQRYQPTYAPPAAYGSQPAYGGQQPTYAAPVYQQPTAVPPVSQPLAPTQQAPAQQSVPVEAEPEVEGSGFENDDSFQNFDGESEEDDIEKFEVRNSPAFDVIDSWQSFAVAQYESGDDFGSNEEVFSGDYSSGGNYNYEGNVAPAAEVTELDGSTVEQAPTEYTGKLISIEFYRADLPNVLKVFTEQTGINFVYPMALVGNTRITVKLKNVPWDAALKGILDANNLAMSRVTDSIIKIDQNQNIANYLRTQNTLARNQALSLPTKTLVFRLSYGNAQTLQQTLSQALVDPNGILPRPIVTADIRTNSLIVEGISQVLGKAKAMIERMDTPTLQAEIAARIVEVSKSAQNFLGVRWGGGVRYDSGRGLGFGSLNFPNSVTANYAIDATRTESTAGDFNFRFGSINDLLDLDLRLQMEEQLNNSETLQSQKILVQDGGNATITSGKQDRFRTVAVPGAENAGAGELAEVNADVTLQLTNLQISNDNMVTMPIRITSDSIAPAGDGAVASTFTREIRTTLVNRSGETVVIGGAYASQKTSRYLGVPFFSKIPIIGALFRQKSHVQDSKELLVMLTPNIMSAERSGSTEIDSFGGASSGGNYNNAPSNDTGSGNINAGGNNNYSENASYEPNSGNNGANGNLSNAEPLTNEASQQSDNSYNYTENQESSNVNDYEESNSAQQEEASQSQEYNYQEEANGQNQQENGQQESLQQENYQYE